MNFLQKYIKYIGTALAFVVALAWRDAFKELFKSNKTLNKFGPWVYAIVVTSIIILLLWLLEKTSDAIDNVDLQKLFKQLLNRESVNRDSIDRVSVDRDSIDRDSVDE